MAKWETSFLVICCMCEQQTSTLHRESVFHQVMSGLDSHCYFKHYQYEQQRKPQLPAEFNLKQQKLCWPRCRRLTHESMSQTQSNKPSGRLKDLCDARVCTCVYILDVSSRLPQLCLHGNLHNKQLYLARDLRWGRGGDEVDNMWRRGGEKVRQRKKERDVKWHQPPVDLMETRMEEDILPAVCE